MADPKVQLQALSDQYQKLQSDLQSQISHRQTLSSQESENTSVLGVFETLKPHNKIYKQIGPVLLTQPLEEARENVQNRLGFIRGEIGRVEGRIGQCQTEMDGLRGEIMGVQARIGVAGEGGEG